MRGIVAFTAISLMALKLFTWAFTIFHNAHLLANVVYASLAFLMLWSYIRCFLEPVTSHPPRVHSASLKPSPDSNDDSEVRYCERCDREKENRVHHCSICNTCVYWMDHHCTWVNNCIGWSNKKYFLLFVLYTSVSCLLFNLLNTHLLFLSTSTPLPRPTLHLLYVTWFLSFVAVFVLGGYFVFNIWLLHTGRTTLDFLTMNAGELPHNELYRNARVYFGDDVWLWWIPVTPTYRVQVADTSSETDELMI